MKTRINIKLFLSIALTITGFLVCITAFSSSYKILSSAHYPEAQDRVENSAIKKVNFIAVGDIMLSRNVARHAEK
ncbi:hypothetical protein H6768_03645 [Candidatus Peribacteria bacterium]|nr:hypothetical protein [Candidatus Peribacteria bacterium]